MTTVPIEEPSGMLEKALDFPSQIAKARNIMEHFDIPSETFHEINKVVYLGMGGSGIIGDFVRILLRNSRIPVFVSKGPIAPRFIDNKTLVIAVSYSGNTWETMAALDTCVSTNAKIVVITSSHSLVALCQTKKITAIRIPENGQTRASFGYLLIPVLDVLHKAGIITRIESDLSESLKVLQEIKTECTSDGLPNRNRAYGIALDFLKKFPIIYGENNFTDAIALRWKQLLNENSKAHCYCEIFPELLHNEIEAWHGSREHIQRNYSLVLLRDARYEIEIGIKEKVEATKELISDKGSTVVEVWTQGESELARLLSLNYLGDFVSIYLAIAKGMDPSDISNIKAIKRVGFVKRGNYFNEY